MPGGFVEAMEAAFQLDPMLMLLLGMFFGALTGLVPGLSGVTGMAIFLPFTIGMGPFPALMFFAGLGGAPRFTGAVTSIVLNIPGSPVNAATAFDGYPMARRGEAGRALAIAATASVLGTAFGLTVLLAAMPIVFLLLDVVGPAELFGLAVLALTTISFASTNTLQGFVRGLASGGLGLMIAFMGVATVTGSPRFNFGSDGYLFDGIQLVPLFIGVFAVSQVMRFAIDREDAVSTGGKGGRMEGVREGIRDTFHHWRILLRGSAIGAAIGAMPGVGGTAANFLSYSWTKGMSKEPDRYGTGIPEGIVATEGANNAEHSSSIVPTLSFGIPGSAEGALILGLLTLQGYITGPLLLVNNPEVLWILVIGTVISVVAVSLLGLASTGLLAKVTLLPLRYLVPGVLIFALLGTYVAETNVWDLTFAVGIGVVAFWFIASGFSPAALVIGYVLGRITENSFVLAYQSGGGSYASLFTRPAALVIWASVAVLTAMATRQGLRRRRQRQELVADAILPTEVAVGDRPSWSSMGFTVVALVFVAYIIIEAGDLPRRVALVPLAIGIPTTLLLSLSLGLEVDRIRRRPAGWRVDTSVVSPWAVFVVVWTVAYAAGIIFIGFIAASVLATAGYVFADGVASGGTPRRTMLVRTLASGALTLVVLAALASVSFGGFEGLLFGERLPPW